MFRADRLVELRKFFGLTQTDMVAIAVNKKLGFGATYYRWFEEGVREPDPADAIALADFFQVSLDYLYGRTDNGIAEYKVDVERVKLDFYEEWLRRSKTMDTDIRLRDDDKVIPVWPYNLIECLQIDVDVPLSDDQLDGLEEAIKNLTTREQYCILYYFGNDKTYDEISEIYGVTRERIRQIIAKGLRKLRHPSRVKLIKYGKEGCKLQAAIPDLEEQLRRYQELESELEYEKSLDGSSDKNAKADLQATWDEVLDTKFMELNPSVRAFNCLARFAYQHRIGNCSTNYSAMTVGDVIDVIINYDISKVRNLGNKTMLEVIDLLKKVGITVTFAGGTTAMGRIEFMEYYIDFDCSKAKGA